jgi:lipid-A-disaccharide synthase-like uncharacterized protein
MYSGKFIFAQVLKFVSQYEFNKSVKRSILHFFFSFLHNGLNLVYFLYIFSNLFVCV